MAYSYSSSCLFVNSQGKLFRVKCPFRVRPITLEGTEKEFVVKRIVHEDETIVLYELENSELGKYSSYRLVR